MLVYILLALLVSIDCFPPPLRPLEELQGFERQPLNLTLLRQRGSKPLQESNQGPSRVLGHIQANSYIHRLKKVVYLLVAYLLIIYFYKK